MSLRVAVLGGGSSGRGLTPKTPALADIMTAVTARIKGASLVTFEDLGHSPQVADPPRFKLASLLRAAIARGRIAGLPHRGAWTDVGTPQRLAELDAVLAQRRALGST